MAPHEGTGQGPERALGAAPEASDAPPRHRASDLKREVWRQLEPRAWAYPNLSPVNRVLIVAILVATASAVMHTEPTLVRGHERLYYAADITFTLLFALKYAARVWSCTAWPAYTGGAGRLKFILTPGALVDAAVVLVSAIAVLAAHGLAGDILPLRLLRLLAILRLAKLGRLSMSMRYMADAVAERRHELGVTAMLASALIVIGATAMWAVEGHIQPEAFGSIPRAMWWAAVTLTTIGYGDVTPATVPGKFIAIVVAMAGIALIAMPAGILAAAFSDALRRQHRE